MKGTILAFYQARGFGYLKDEEKDEYCFYLKDMQKPASLMKKGDRVYFDLYKGHGVRAVNVGKEPLKGERL